MDVDSLGEIEPPEYMYNWTYGNRSLANGHTRA